MSAMFNLSEKELVEACQKNDYAAFEEVIRRYKNLIYSIPLNQFNLDSHYADAVWVDVFNRFHKNVRKIKNPEKLASWLITTTNNCCRRFLKKEKKWETMRETIEDNQVDLDDSIQRRQCKYLLEIALSRISSKCRKLLHQLFYEEYSYEEVSKTVDMPKGAIGPTKKRCLENLAKKLKIMGVSDEDL